jgi:hypothetical protein
VGPGGSSEAEGAISIGVPEPVEAFAVVEAVVPLEAVETPVFEYELDADSIEVYPAGDDGGVLGDTPAGQRMRDQGDPAGPDGGIDLRGDDDGPGF